MVVVPLVVALEVHHQSSSFDAFPIAYLEREGGGGGGGQLSIIAGCNIILTW